MNSILGRLLYLTIGAAMFVLWRMADLWSQRGLGDRAAAARCAVILVAVIPFWWALREVNSSLGPEAAVACLAGMVGMVVLWLVAAWAGRCIGRRRCRYE